MLWEIKWLPLRKWIQYIFKNTESSKLLRACINIVSAAGESEQEWNLTGSSVLDNWASKCNKNQSESTSKIFFSRVINPLGIWSEVWHFHLLSSSSLIIIGAFTTVMIQVELFWVVTSYSFVVVYKHFRGPRFLHLQDEMDLWNVGILSQHYTLLQPIKPGL